MDAADPVDPSDAIEPAEPSDASDLADSASSDDPQPVLCQLHAAPDGSSSGASWEEAAQLGHGPVHSFLR